MPGLTKRLRDIQLRLAELQNQPTANTLQRELIDLLVELAAVSFEQETRLNEVIDSLEPGEASPHSPSTSKRIGLGSRVIQQ